MELLEKAFPFLLTTALGFLLGQLKNVFAYLVEEAKTRAVIAREASAAHLRLDRFEARFDELDRTVNRQLSDLSNYVMNKKEMHDGST